MKRRSHARGAARWRRAGALTLSLWIITSLRGITLARDLTVEERVRAQEAIERVYFSHQIGAVKRFEEAVPRGVIEQKVRRYLEETAVLRDIWHVDVTGQMLENETARLGRETRMPQRLRELYAALGSDPFLIQECLARPVLVDRLARGFYSWDRASHTTARARAEALLADLRSGVPLEPPQTTPAADCRNPCGVGTYAEQAPMAATATFAGCP